MRVSYKFDATKPLAFLIKKAGVLRSGLVTKAMITSAERYIIPAARRNLRANKSIFEGNLFRSLSAKASTTGSSHFVEVGTFGVEYGLNIEKGTPAGLKFSDTSKMIRWARIKAGANNPSLMARRTIARIESHGTAPRPFLMPAWETTKDSFYRDVAARLGAALR